MLVGVDDTGNVVGLENDMRLVHRNRRRDKDAFAQKLKQLILSYLGGEKGTHVHLTWESSEGKDVARIGIDEGESPTFVKHDEFYLRLGNCSEPLTLKEAAAYIRKKWPNWQD